MPHNTNDDNDDDDNNNNNPFLNEFLSMSVLPYDLNMYVFSVRLSVCL
jgi:hypothetical protein